MPNQTMTIEHEKEKKDRVFSKEEVCTICNLSINTLQNWINEEKTEDKDFLKGKQGKRFYNIGYLKRIFKRVLREDLISILEVNNEVNQHQPKVNLKSTEPLPTLDHAQLFNQMSETIKILQDQLRSKDSQISHLHDQIEKQSNLMQNEQTLRLQQNQILLESKSTKARGFFGFFKGKSKATEEKDL
jgi:hypothetical protein